MAEDRLELAHESLLYDWSYFQTLLEKEQLSRYRRLRLTKDVEDWADQGRPPDLLWRGVAIEEAENYSRLSAAEVSFLSASRETDLSTRLERESAAMQIANLSRKLKQMEEQNLSLEAQVRSLTSETPKFFVYQKKYRILRALVMLFLSIATAAVCLTVIAKSGINRNTQQTEERIFDKN